MGKEKAYQEVDQNETSDNKQQTIEKKYMKFLYNIDADEKLQCMIKSIIFSVNRDFIEQNQKIVGDIEVRFKCNDEREKFGDINMFKIDVYFDTESL